MKNLMTALILLSVVVFATGDKDLSKKPTTFNNPQVVFGVQQTEMLGTIFESFEGTVFPPAGWVKLNYDGGTGWTTIDVGTTPLPGWTGGTVIAPPVANAGTKQAFCTYTTGGASANNQWLITSQITNVQPNDSLKFWMRKFGSYLEVVNVKISTTNNSNQTSFTVPVAALNFTAADSGWLQYKYKIGNLVPTGSNIYIGFQEIIADNFNDGAAILLDLVEVTGEQVPVELAGFSTSISQNDVSLMWQTATETNNKGFEIERKAKDGKYTSLGFVDGRGTTTIEQVYSFVDKGVAPGKYSYRLKQVDFDGTSEIIKSVEVEVVNPLNYTLEQNYPNPFNPSTNVSFTLAVDSKVSLKVFNVLGQEIATLVNATMTAGQHTVQFNAKNLQSGVYFAKIEANGVNGKNFSSVKKMILNK